MKSVIVKSWTVSFWPPEIVETRSPFFESFFGLLETEFFDFLSFLISFSYFSFFNSFVCDGLRDGEIPCLQKYLDGLDDHSFLCIFLLLGLELVFVKLGLFSGAQAVTWAYEGCTHFRFLLESQLFLRLVLDCVLDSCISWIYAVVKFSWLLSCLFEWCLESRHIHLCPSFVLIWFEFHQNFTISFIIMKENSFRFEYQLSTNSWSQLPIVGSSKSSNPLGISLFFMHQLKHSLSATYLADVSFNRFSFSASL